MDSLKKEQDTIKMMRQVRKYKRTQNRTSKDENYNNWNLKSKLKINEKEDGVAEIITKRWKTWKRG